ncbi:MAG: hypothetical protein J2O47_00090 [Acidimicrobiaceae bacterium]|nr:hypothetical protein [Acidimicrobiaceae bacterium]
MSALSIRRPLLLAAFLAAAALCLAALVAPLARADFSDFDFASTSASLSTQQAGAHPDVTTSFTLNGDPSDVDGVGQPHPWGSLRNLHVQLPAGMTGNPQAFPKCSAAVFLGATNVFFGGPDVGQCPTDSQIGIASPGLWQFFPSGLLPEPLYNLDSPGGDVVARLGFYAVGFPIYIDIRIDPERGNALTASVVNAPSAAFLTSTITTIWGVPTDSSHDTQRFTPVDAINCFGQCGPPVPSGLGRTAFMTNPTSCGPKQVGFGADSYPGFSATPTSASLGDITGCQSVPFSPSISLQPTTQQADSSSGMDVHIHVPQDGLANPNGLGSAHLKRAVVTLPEGMALNPSAADGLQGCTEAQIGLLSEGPPATFDASTPSCANGSVVGTATIDTPVLDDPIPGRLYLADPDDNPFHSLLTGYLVAQGEGVLLKIPGRFDRDPQTGRITATFDDNPQQPFTDLDLHFKGGARGVLVTPPSCGTYQIDSELSPWSAADPDNPTPAETKDLTTTFDVASGPGGGPCPDYTDPARFTPGFSAGTTVPLAGSGTGFALKVTRPDGQQSLKQIHLDLPPGVVAKLAGVPRCAQSQITPGIDGQANCPAGSQIGTVNVGAGAGSTPFFLTDQPVYLTDGYNGAPYGIAIDTHALAGPFDLGHVVVRSTLNVDKDDAQVHIDSEQLPSILQGIPLHIRSVSVNVDKPGFMQNPTNCNPMTVTGTVTGGGEDFADPADDTVKPVSDRFQVGGCGGLGFSPKLSGTILNGAQGIHRSDHPNLSFHLAPTAGDANLASVAVTLPQAFQIDQANLGNICSETELATNECAGRNTVGTASATTPLLASTLSGPVYAVSGSGGLPKLAVILNGPAADPVHLLVRGITTTVGARLANTFPLVPDTPVSAFDLTLNGGPAGYLVNNTNVCGKKKKTKKGKRFVRTPLRADALFTAQDGDTLSQSVPISAQCPKAKKSSKASRRKGKRHR